MDSELYQLRDYRLELIRKAKLAKDFSPSAEGDNDDEILDSYAFKHDLLRPVLRGALSENTFTVSPCITFTDLHYCMGIEIRKPNGLHIGAHILPCTSQDGDILQIEARRVLNQIVPFAQKATGIIIKSGHLGEIPYHEAVISALCGRYVGTSLVTLKEWK